MHVPNGILNKDKMQITIANIRPHDFLLNNPYAPIYPGAENANKTIPTYLVILLNVLLEKSLVDRIFIIIGTPMLIINPIINKIVEKIINNIPNTVKCLSILLSILYLL